MEIKETHGQNGTDGTDGEDGEDGIGVSEIIEQYYLSTSNSTQTGGSWQATQPTWENNKYIWIRSKITWTDNTITYTTPILADSINKANETAYSTSQDLANNYYTITETDAQININTNSINAVTTEVSTLKTTVNNNYTSLKGELDNYATTENVEVIKNSVQALQTTTSYYIGLTEDIQQNGVSKVTTEKGFTFDNNGLTIDETNAKTKSNLDTDGLVVLDKTSSNNEVLLQAGYDDNTGETIVKSKNMTVEKYLSIGAYSRIEDYEDTQGNLGTAIFWTGG